MTTIACNRREIAADSCVTHGDIGIGAGQYRTPKLHRIGRSIFGERGESMAGVSQALWWLRKGAKRHDMPKLPKDADFYLLELAPQGIFLWDSYLDRELIDEPNFTIGSGGKVALYCMRELKMTPAQAVAEAAKVDAYTRAPIITMKLKG
jgi:ATP-dependent protease HslVU (ClpYQ) peptidase subunit